MAIIFEVLHFDLRSELSHTLPDPELSRTLKDFVQTLIYN